MYARSQAAPGTELGCINTLLLTSSRFVARAVDAIRQQAPLVARHFLSAAIACGLGFIAVKAFEYHRVISGGFSLVSNEFFVFYFVLTGLHLLHVLVGLVILSFIRHHSASPIAQSGGISLVECGACYWHMVDLLWICLFALLYLVR